MRLERGIEVDELDLIGGSLAPGGETVSGALIAKLREAVHHRINQDDVRDDDLDILTLCRRHEELVAQALRMEAVIHEWQKGVRG